jgi:chromate transporter
VPAEGSPGEVFTAFLKLGCISFGGPIAHLGYFRAEFVERRKWLDEARFSEIVALCQFLPGPASSQTGFTIGLQRAGWRGAVAGWVGFTLPTAVLLVLFGYGAGDVAGTVWGAEILHGLNLVAVAVIAQAVRGMAMSFCPDRTRATIGTAAALLAAAAPVSIGQITAIGFGAVAGFLLLRQQPGAVSPDRLAPMISPRAGTICLGLFTALLLLPPLLRGWSPDIRIFDAFYRSGALVFGGGHVVLPLLRDAVVTPGFVSDKDFLAGYGATQAMPGPIFTFAAYLGTVMHPVPDGSLGRAAGAVLPLVAIFLPGFLLLLGVLPFWDQVRTSPAAQAAMRGVNAAVVGVLGAALYDPIWTSAILTDTDFYAALILFVLLTVWRARPILVVALGAVSRLVL